MTRTTLDIAFYRFLAAIIVVVEMEVNQHRKNAKENQSHYEFFYD
jgi:hypothetical protein